MKATTDHGVPIRLYWDENSGYMQDRPTWWMKRFPITICHDCGNTSDYERQLENRIKAKLKAKVSKEHAGLRPLITSGTATVTTKWLSRWFSATLYGYTVYFSGEELFYVGYLDGAKHEVNAITNAIIDILGEMHEAR